MSNISIRLPEELENRLSEEARRSHKPRSELARQAIADYLQRVERERLMAEMAREAEAAYAEPPARQEALTLAEAGLDAWLSPIEADEQQQGIDSQDRWWS